ncbi:MAG: FAD:protein FMN transferase [Bacteroidaceae bacterium]|nr:FAD:protein FMN transferase [Bacteroidaceae bacterium]
MKKWQLPFLLLLIAGTAFIIRRHNPPTDISFQQDEGYIFGTIFHAKYQSRENLHEEIMQELNAVDASLSMFNPQSCISRINQGETIDADSLLQIVFLQALSISRATDGAFDPTIAPLVNAWGFGFKNGALPDSAMVDSLRSLVGWQHARLIGNRIVRDNDQMVFDFSAIAKGFGADQVGRMFARHGISNYMIEIGGEIVCKGTNPEGEVWKIGINKPTEDNNAAAAELETVLRLTDCAMATSGNYRNYFVRDGIKYAHTIDPHTGYPIQRSVVSSTVLAPTCAMADGFATAFMVMGLEAAQQLLSNHPELKAYLIYIDEEGQMRAWKSEGLDEAE